MPDIQVPDDDALPPNLSGFSKPGFEFAGWAWSQEDADKGWFSLVTPRGGGTLFAVWRVAGSGPTPPALPTWSAAGDVSLPLANAESAQVAVDATGLATAVWDRYDGSNYIVQSSTSLDGGAWSTPEDLSATGQNSIIPQVTVDATGTATAVWVRNTGSGSIIQSSTRPSGGSWSTPEDLSASGQNAFDPQVTVDSTGTAIAVWSRSNGSNTIIQASTRPSGGSWSTPVDLSETGQDATNPQVTVDANGTAIAVWSRSNGTNTIIQSSTRPSGGSWTTPADNLSAVGQDASAPQVSVDATGTAIAVWSRSNGTNTIIQSSTRPSGGPWSTPAADLSATGQDASAPQVTVDATGTATAVWSRSNGTNTIIQASTRPSGGSWTTPENLSEPLGSAIQPQVTVDSTGLAAAVWNRYDGSNNIIQSSMRSSGGSWSTPADNLSLPLQDAFAPQIAAGASGRVVAVWEQGNGSNNIIQSKSFANAASPASGGASLPNTGANLALPLGVATTLLLTGFVIVVLRRRDTKA